LVIELDGADRCMGKNKNPAVGNHRGVRTTMPAYGIN